MQTSLKLFVYGSFCEGMVHYSRLEPYVVSAKPGSIKGRAYALEVGFPAVVLRGDDRVISFMGDRVNEQADYIDGQLLELEASPIFFKLLDEFHGFSPLIPEKSLYWRSPIIVDCESEQVEAEIYSLNPAKLPRNAKLIEKGDWKMRLSQQPAITKSLSSTQAEFVQKLGDSGGRDILPIDLEVYRQLMKLDLIVDKGRRLALTKLGKEVYRYLS